MGKYFDIGRFFDRLPKILPYLNITFQIVIVTMILGTLLGIMVAILRIRKIPILHQILGIYISFMRGTPVLVQMFITYYGIPLVLGNLFLDLFGINLNSVNVLIFVEIAIILNEGAFLGEIFRSAILAIPSVQSEAGYSIGMTNTQTFIRIVLPQAIKVAIPQYGVDLIGVFQNTSLVFVLGVLDIMGKAKTLGVATGHAIEGFVAVACIYIVISLLLKAGFLFLESRMAYGRR